MINVLRKSTLFAVYSSYPCFPGALIFRNEKGFFGLFLLELLQL